MKIKRIIAGVLAVILLLGIVPLSSVKAATSFETLRVTELSDMDDFSVKAEKSWEIKWNFTEEQTTEQSYYGKFTITKDSRVCISANVENPGSVQKYTYYLYGTESMGTDLDSQEYGCWVLYEDEVRYTYYDLKAGTYYIKNTCKLNGKSSISGATSKMIIATVPSNKDTSFSQKANKTKTKVTVNVNEKLLIGEPYRIQYLEGKVSSNGNWNYSTNITATKSFTVNKNGWYTVRFEDKEWGTYWYRYVKVTGIDKTKPTVTGVKNGKKYKKAVTIKFKDNKGGSGIKKATLNGKKIKSGKKVSKKGKYTLVVKDKAGNKKTIKFTIK